MTRKNYTTPAGLSGFGPDANCTISTCDLKYSAYEYRPSLGANGLFLALFAISAIIHMAQGFYASRNSRHSRQWFYSIAMTIGCICEIIGYIARVLLWYNPFEFNYFLIQIITITFAPAFFSAAIYITIGQIVRALGAPRFDPRYYAYIFITCDIVALTLQAAGGGLSTGGAGQTGVWVSIAGLAFQVASTLAFILLVSDWVRHYRSASRAGTVQRTFLPQRFRVFIALITSALVLILARCAYRIAELSKGYEGSIFVDQASFIVLEGVFMSITTFLLNFANPLRYFDRSGSLIGGVSDASPRMEEKVAESAA